MQPRTILCVVLPFLTSIDLSLGESRANQPAIVHAPDFDIEYHVNEAALPLESVRLWYTTDQGATWTEYGRDEDRISPFRFRSPGEGHYGFFFVLTNGAGPSSEPPVSGTAPQQTALVDYTPPLVQLHQARSVGGTGEATVQLRWTAVDGLFGPRPIEVWYGTSLEDTNLRATEQPMANTGRYDWRLPPGMSGSVAVRVTATDRAGLRGESEAMWVEIAPPPTVPETGSAALPLEIDDSALPGTSRAKEKAAALYALAMEEAGRGNLTGGVFRLREAVKLDPHNAQAFAEMGGMLYSLGDLDRALGAYEIALKQQPYHRGALRGMARVYQRKNDMASAAEKLNLVLRQHPTDAEVWLELGDVSIHQGDEVRARECYTRASQTDPKATKVIAEAQQRLTLLADLSRSATRKASQQISQKAGE